ncbi:hypothetical protein [Burkholderia glumae]|uniref:Uncharacterized protein n=2 Tax=Burkholderia glumae TaxID=337 RepID=A0ABY5BCZ0_BURGL|nr:hypothetical protein [Burkholderia glumae]KHJ60285.1 hypothetical protein NCPPB3923_24880 [Burkholderia glumae]MCM2485556.1 hypothetical protein [Burkholderia glumae]MCM2493726.1 hypothetical protein [Burkholderia glumae]MCM2511250.1 hypothetical protein [Burkholderia glumae]MCM2546921.1 hypothetical protein [Burkholderia glumae]
MSVWDVSRTIRWAGAVAVFGSVWTASTAEAGTIYFTGAIVAPPYGVTVSVEPAVSPAGTHLSGAAVEDGKITVKFSPVRYNEPSAKVSLTVLHEGSRGALVTAFIDGAGHPVPPTSDGAYQVGVSGGALTISPRSGAGSAATMPAVITTSYN